MGNAYRSAYTSRGFKTRYVKKRHAKGVKSSIGLPQMGRIGSFHRIFSPNQKKKKKSSTSPVLASIIEVEGLCL